MHLKELVELLEKAKKICLNSNDDAVHDGLDKAIDCIKDGDLQIPFERWWHRKRWNDSSNLQRLVRDAGEKDDACDEFDRSVFSPTEPK